MEFWGHVQERSSLRNGRDAQTKSALVFACREGKAIRSQ
ncbi:hypothetical protein NBRC3255_2582 [Gluconobacter thailandicus NBRC 3255]|nr:hypothetical protein NBRC3255_2582 [Gluconobacter thailandicus NBRC 3255]